jgi:hypothetical protein
MFRKYKKYETVPQSDEDIVQDKLSGNENRSVFTHSVTPVILGFVCTVNFAMGLAIVWQLYGSSGSAYDVHELESRSPYIGFDVLYGNQSIMNATYPPIYTQARVLAPVYANEPDRVEPVWGNQHLTPDGYVPVAERHLFVTHEVSTVAQFRIQDYGMEKCSVTLEVPAFNDTYRKASIWGFRNASIDVWALEGTAKLDFRNLSWRTKPRRRRHMGTISPSYNSTYELPEFRCISGTYQSVEVACASETPYCHVDVVRAGWEHGAFYVVQRQSIPVPA